MGILAWIVGLVLAVGILIAGGAKLRGVEMMEATRERLNVAPGLWRFIGGAEVLAAPGLIIGLFSDGQGAEWIGFLAALGLIALMIGAIVYHIRAADEPKEWGGAIMMLILSVLYIVFIGAR